MHTHTHTIHTHTHKVALREKVLIQKCISDVGKQSLKGVFTSSTGRQHSLYEQETVNSFGKKNYYPHD